MFKVVKDGGLRSKITKSPVNKFRNKNLDYILK